MPNAGNPQRLTNWTFGAISAGSARLVGGVRNIAIGFLNLVNRSSGPSANPWPGNNNLPANIYA
jgi:hypothetical protein